MSYPRDSRRRIYIRRNEQIRAREVRLIDESGKQLGIFPLQEAIREARRRGLDLIEVAPQASPVVCKIADFGKYKYQQEKREKLRRQKTQKLKEIRMRSRIEKHDFETKLRRIREFLEEDSKVKVTIFFKGREIVHLNRGRDLLDRVVQELGSLAKVDQPPHERGRTLQMLLVPTGNLAGGRAKKPEPPAGEPQRQDQERERSPS